MGYSSFLTNEEVSIRGGNTKLFFQVLVEEGREPSKNRGEAALCQDQQYEEWIEEQS